MNHVLCMLFCDCFQIWILSICNGNQKGTSEMSNWFVGIMPGSLIPLNCEPLTADIHGCLQKTPRMSDCLWLYFHLRSSLSGCFSSLLKFRFIVFEQLFFWFSYACRSIATQRSSTYIQQGFSCHFSEPSFYLFRVVKYPSPYLNSSRKWKNLTVLCSANVEVCKMPSNSY